jgi:hypothetical protein
VPTPKLCIFCPNPRTSKRGEHVWDNWLNRKDGRDIRDNSTTSYYGYGHELIREHKSTRIDVTIPVVCDACNSTWMSDITSFAKDILEPSIRHDKPIDLDARDIVTVTAFSFMKSAVLDWSVQQRARQPCISRSTCLTFRDSLASPRFTGDIALPEGLQVWIARYKRTRIMEAQAFTEEMSHSRHLKGYRVLVINYLVGSFVFQLLYPRYSGASRKRPSPPFFNMVNDEHSVPIWPGVSEAYWPPLRHIDSRTFESFRERFRRVRIPRPGSA